MRLPSQRNRRSYERKMTPWGVTSVCHTSVKFLSSAGTLSRSETKCSVPALSGERYPKFSLTPTQILPLSSIAKERTTLEGTKIFRQVTPSYSRIAPLELLEYITPRWSCRIVQTWGPPLYSFAE